MNRSPLKWSQVFLCTLLLGGVALLLYRHDTVAVAVHDGLLLCLNTIIPSLFPLFVAISLLMGCGLGRFLPPELSALVLGLLGGYPVGAKTVAELLQSGVIDRKTGQVLLLCCNNAGPAFILGVVGYGLFHRAAVGWALYAIHGLTAVLFFAVLPRPQEQSVCALPMPPFSFSKSFVQAVRSGVTAMGNICGFVVLFLVILRLLSTYAGVSHPLLLGAVELTNGILMLPNTADGFVMASALLSFGGLSVLCQTAAVLDGSGVKLWPYLLAKLGQAVISAALAFLVRGLLF